MKMFSYCIFAFSSETNRLCSCRFAFSMHLTTEQERTLICRITRVPTMWKHNVLFFLCGSLCWCCTAACCVKALPILDALCSDGQEWTKELATLLTISQSYCWRCHIRTKTRQRRFACSRFRYRPSYHCIVDASTWIQCRPIKTVLSPFYPWNDCLIVKVLSWASLCN